MSQTKRRAPLDVHAARTPNGSISSAWASDWDGSRQSSKDIFLYLASQEFLAMYAVAQPDDAAHLQQEFINELCRSGKDRNQFRSLDQLRALVIRDAFRLETAPVPDLASAQPTLEIATQPLISSGPFR
jgi:hypothetical protein